MVICEVCEEVPRSCSTALQNSVWRLQRMRGKCPSAPCNLRHLRGLDQCLQLKLEPTKNTNLQLVPSIITLYGCSANPDIYLMVQMRIIIISGATFNNHTRMSRQKCENNTSKRITRSLNSRTNLLFSHFKIQVHVVSSFVLLCEIKFYVRPLRRSLVVLFGLGFDESKAFVFPRCLAGNSCLFIIH